MSLTELGLHLHLYLTSISTSSTTLACSILIGYVREICRCAYMFNSDFYKIYACIFNSCRICAQNLHSNFLTCMGLVPTCLILVRYVHEFCVLTF